MGSTKLQSGSFEAGSDLVQSLLDSFHDAVLVLDEGTRTILACNSGCERTFGYRKDELIGHSTEKIHVNKYHFNRFGGQSSLELESNGVYSGAYKMRRKDGTVFDSFHRVVFATDTTGRKLALSFVWEAGFNSSPSHPEWLAKIIAPGIREANNLPAAIRVLIEALCRAYGWPYGEAWFPHHDETLDYALGWHEEIEALSEFAEVSRRKVFALNTGLIGRVVASQRPEWIENLHSDATDDFDRIVAAHRAGLQSTVAFPVMWNTNLLGVIMMADTKTRFRNEKMEREIQKVLQLLENELGAQSMSVRVAETISLSDEASVAHPRTPSLFGSRIPMIVYDDTTFTILDCNDAASHDNNAFQQDIINRRLTDVIPIEPNTVSDISQRMAVGTTVSLMPEDRWQNDVKEGPIVFRHVIWNGRSAVCMACIKSSTLTSIGRGSTTDTGLEPDGVRRLKRLTLRQQEVLSHLMDHKSNKEIARTLSVSHRTVAAHRAMILQKFNASAIHDVIDQIGRIFH